MHLFEIKNAQLEMDRHPNEINGDYELRMSGQFPHLTGEELQRLLKDVESNEIKFSEELMENYYSNDSKEYPNLVEDGNGEAGLISTENGVVTGTDDIKQDFIGISNLIANTDLQYQKQSIDMIPANNNFPGQFNFELIMNTSSKFSWVYSSSLNKVFINMGHSLPIQFRWTPSVSDLYVRATPLFALPQHSQEPVLRCLNHSSSTDLSNKDVPPYIHRHILRCLQPQTQYLCNDGRLSILTPLGHPQPGADTVRLMYTFMCKNSCSSGMNRRPLEIVFTLETIDGVIYGRRKLEVRICSCPKRDKDKEEGELKGVPGTKKRKINSTHHNSDKKPMVQRSNNLGLEDEVTADVADIAVHSLTVDVVGQNVAKKVLIYTYDAMAGEAAKRNSLEFYQPYLDEIERKIRAIN